MNRKCIGEHCRSLSKSYGGHGLRSVSKRLQTFCKISYLLYTTVAERSQTVLILNAAL